MARPGRYPGRVTAADTGPAPIKIAAPAKVNLCLLVGPPREDGYHDLLTVFAPVGLVDEIEFSLVACPPDGPREPLFLHCPGIDVADNLMIRALDVLEEAIGWHVGGAIRVKKGIPIGAGLGGGSSDAAAAMLEGLRVVAAAGGPRPEPAEVIALARSIGADVPFFLDPRTALAKGVGDRLEPLALPDIPIVIVLPHEQLSTAEAYRTYDGVAPQESLATFHARADRSERAWRAVSGAWVSGELTLLQAALQLSGILANDLERATFHLLPLLIARKAALERHGALGALLSGSGPSLFGVCPSLDHARSVAQALRAEGMPAHATITGGASPVRAPLVVE
jgi:4-diphosphocytidyl-2-C-methyl-D-erythritol kinase